MPVPTPAAVNYAQALEGKLNEYKEVHYPNLPDISVHVEAGKVYDKLVKDDGGYGGSVHAFVVRATGDLVKAASWSAPAKSKTHPSGLAVRYNLSTPQGFAEAVSKCTSYGYLYAN